MVPFPGMPPEAGWACAVPVATMSTREPECPLII